MDLFLRIYQEGVGSMRRLLGHLTWGVSLGVLLATIGAGEVRAADVFGISISITDVTAGTPAFTATILSTSPNNISVDPNIIQVSPAFSTAASGVALTGLKAFTVESATSTNLEIQGTATINPGSTDNYSIVITTTHDSYTTPTGTSATLAHSESGTWTFTSVPGSQGFNSWYNPGSAPFVVTGVTPGAQSFPITVSGQGTQSGSANTPTNHTFGGYVQPYTLTNQITINLTGNGATNNAVDAFQGSTTIMAVPEPASLVMFLTGMPVPLMVLGMLRRRKASRKTDLSA
jgi:hypothetical protein